MKVAIMGAGLSGLSCAVVLERLGIRPTIFESRSRVGDRFINGEAILTALHNPIPDGLEYFKDHLGIALKPISNIKKIDLFSRSKHAVLTGELGISNIRGRHRDSFESQLASQIKSDIVFDSKYTYGQLKEEFSHVVIATGDAAYASQMGNYDVDLTVSLKGVTVEGSFDVDNVVIWLNNSFAPRGYGYLIPYSQREASLAIGFPDYPKNNAKDIDCLWNAFFNQACIDLKQSLKITDSFQIRNYILGLCKQVKIDNTYFVGNCMGSIMPAFGFGQFDAVLTGAYCAYDIGKINSYEMLTKVIREGYNNSLVLRRAVEKMDDNKLDLLLEVVNTKLANRALNSRVDVIKIVSQILKPIV